MQLRIFDENGDGKLSLAEMSQLFPTKENILKATMGESVLRGHVRKLDYQEIENIFKEYDKVR